VLVLEFAHNDKCSKHIFDITHQALWKIIKEIPWTKDHGAPGFHRT
jgi:hypothetical protein